MLRLAIFKSPFQQVRVIVQAMDHLIAIPNYFFPPDCTVVVSDELLLPGFGSFVLELTVAVLVIVVLPRMITVT